MTNERRPRDVDVAVVGGGAAGLSGALALARARRSVLVIDSGEPRNAPAGHVHNYLTRDGTPPAELLQLGRDEVTSYGGRVVSGTVTVVVRADGLFRLTLEDGSWVRARRLLVTTGLVDALPEVEGMTDRWGRDVLHCPYCHGWEAQDREIVVLGSSPMAPHQAQMWRQWSDRVTLVRHTAAPFDAETTEQLTARGITLVDARATRLVVRGDTLVGLELQEGAVIDCDFVVIGTGMRTRSELLEQLGLQTSELEIGGQAIGTYVASDDNGTTEVPGVWVAGNVTSPMDQVIMAAASGLRAGAVINADLIAEETKVAVDARRAAEAKAS